MDLHGPQADEEMLGDLPVGHSTRREIGDPAFGRSERVHTVERAGTGPVAEGTQLPQRARREHTGTARMGDADRLLQVRTALRDPAAADGQGPAVRQRLRVPEAGK